MVEREVVPVPTAMNDEPEDTTLSYKIEDLPADPPVIPQYLIENKDRGSRDKPLDFHKER